MNDYKICTLCGAKKSLNEFHKASTGRYGVRGECKSCVSEKRKKYYHNNRDKALKATKIWQFNNKEKIKKDSKIWRSNNKKKYLQYGKTWTQKNKYKRSASRQLRYAVNSGKVRKEPCKICGNLISEGHHEDYSKPLEVIWLCHKHHILLHIEKKGN